MFFGSVFCLFVFLIISDCSFLKDSYEFQYSIEKDGILIQQQESRRNNHAIGSYSVLQPDDQIRHVRYDINGDGGYNAIVEYIPFNHVFMGHLKYPRDLLHPIAEMKPVAMIPQELLSHSDKKKKYKVL